jgi:biopolymer transport protein ExbD
VTQQNPPASTRSPAKPQASAVKYKAELRKAIRRNAQENEVNFLNITAMLDMMTIILVFLLKNMTSSNAAPPQGDDLRLPKSVMIGNPKEDGVPVLITKTQILVGDDPNPVVMLPSREAVAQAGVDARYKRSGPNDMYIVPLANSLQSIREIDKALRVAKGLDEKSEAIIICDEDTPYRLLTEVLFTLGQSEFGKFHLMALTGSAAKLRASPRSLADRFFLQHRWVVTGAMGAGVLVNAPPQAGSRS